LSIKTELESLLKTTSGEREIHAFLKKNPRLVWGTFCNCGGHTDAIVSEFRFRDKYRSDFVVMQSYSGAWEVHFVELEPVDVELFTKKDKPRQRFQGAIHQLEDWKRFSINESPALRACLADAIMNDDILFPEDNTNHEPSNYTSNNLRDPATVIWFNFHIVIGRRETLSVAEQQLKSSYQNLSGVKVHTYDRLLQVAKTFETGKHLDITKHEKSSHI